MILPKKLARPLEYLNQQNNIIFLSRTKSEILSRSERPSCEDNDNACQKRRVGGGIALHRRFSNHLGVFRFNRVSSSKKCSSQLTSDTRSSWSARQHDHRRSQGVIPPVQLCFPPWRKGRHRSSDTICSNLVSGAFHRQEQ